ncbi:hypothetical protein G7070_02775 [Propioniciclava coleopterorum]|uniref:Prenyltransferase and squalene oxidase repeat-containing protein n=1 Tax=Propioniciclava coleopterorum TaxID=2714937 RepID=A0A6G7Y3X8_9ACTN|nr:prenyltransferase/squalene oxidase repeat-containing protein [Propioniciclava coleopterorum]QIK71409.1 hypothetical protein G7070_02775 [Propioniciclava coleopterorum]
MNVRRNAIVAGIATVLALCLTGVLPAHASDPAAATKAAGWVAQQSIDDPAKATDALVALAAANDPATAPAVEKLTAVLTGKGKDYAAGSPEAAAKVAVALESVGQDPRTAAGADLIAAVKGGIAADGSFGSYPGPFATGLAAVALTRADEAVPDALGSKLLTFQNADGGFTYEAGQPSDADSTALAMQALSALGDQDNLDKAIAWAQANVQADGSFAGFNPVNSTAVMAAALAPTGQNVADSVAYLVGQQQPGGAFQNAGADDLLATAQATLGLAGVSYLDAAWSEAPSPSPTATPAGTTGPAASPGATAGATPAPTGAPTATAPGGVDPSGWFGPAAAVLVLAGAAVVGFRSRAS